MTLRTRLSVLSVSLLLLLLVAGGIFQYLALGVYLRRDAAGVLQQRYNQTIRDLSVRGRVCTTAGQLGTGAAGTGAAGTRATPAVVAGHITAAAAQCITQAVGGPLVTAVVIDANGGVIGSAPTGVSPPTLALGEYLAAGRGNIRSYYLVGDGSSESLIVLHSLTRNGRNLGVVQMSESTSTLRQTQERLLTILAVATGALILLAVVLMPLLVGRALIPLRRVTEASTELAGGDFTRRVTAPPTKDELGRLARAFNEMAAAVERAFAIRDESEVGMRHFVGDASHELRTPLTTLQGQLDLLGRGAATDPAVQSDSLTAMQREVTRMSGLVEDLLTLTRLDGTNATEDRVRERVDVDGLISDTVDEQSVRAPDQRVAVEAATPGHALTLGDPDQLRRVVLNLANNALVHAPGETHTWRSAAQGTDVVFSLTDQGPGIPADAVPRLFDRFYRGQSRSGQTDGGSGLGLAIVKSIVEAHGGTVEAAGSSAGATITVRLPRLTATAPGASKAIA